MPRWVVGVLIWCALLVAGWLGFGRYAVQRGLFEKLFDFATSRQRELILRLDPPQPLQVGDPLYVWPANDHSPSPVGRVARVESKTSNKAGVVKTDFAVVALYASAPTLLAEDQIFYISTPASLTWVIETMLPPATRRQMGEMVVAAWTTHREMIWNEIQPVVMTALRESATVIAEDFVATWKRHEPALGQIADRYRDDYLQRYLVPVFQRDVWPIVQTEMQPLVEQLGLRLWERVSVVGLAWRYLYDLSPLPQRDLVRREFQRFVEQEAMPLFAEFMPGLIQAQQRIIDAISRHPRVREVIAIGLQQLAQDAHAQQLILTMLQESVISNPRLVEVWRRAWQTPEAQLALDRIGEALEPSIVDIGRMLFGSPHEEITPDFSRVLRNRILFKDERWLVLALAQGHARQRGRAEPMQMIARPGPRELLDGFNPFHVPARKRE